jgi:hypothetical protein
MRGRDGAKLRARLNHFLDRARLHAGREYPSLRARILVNAGYGYRAVKNAPVRAKKLRLSDDLVGHMDRVPRAPSLLDGSVKRP